MSLGDKLYTPFLLLSIMVGVFSSRFEAASEILGHLILPFLMFMLYASFLQIPISEIRSSFYNRSFAIASILMNFVLTPIIAWILATVFLSNHPALWLGFIMLMITPCTDWYLIFTRIAKGNIALSTSILPVNLLLQILLLPIYLYLFSGRFEMINIGFVIKGVMLTFILPFLLATGTRYLVVRWKKESLIGHVGAFPVLFLCLTIIAMFASQGSLLLINLHLLLLFLIPIIIFFCLNFIIGRVIGRRLQFQRSDIASLNLTTLARNSPFALAIALAAFPHEPLIALALVIGPLLELPLLSFISFAIRVLDKRK